MGLLCQIAPPSITLWEPFTHPPLCVLASTPAQAYDHAYEMIQCFRHLPMGSEVLLQMDRLVTLLETPCFTSLRCGTGWTRSL